MADLTVSHLSKRYRIAGAALEPRGWLARARSALQRPTHDFWALRDVSFEVRRGETFGIVGRNGAGKSTLLKILSRITAPTEGEVRILGRLVALIELGSGFHPELTGRENVFLNGAILGMRRREVSAKLDQIVEFAGVREFIDVPVKWYSSGMYVRLGFAIAAHLEQDILLVDEVLAVGDAAFQARCFSRIAELKRDGATVLIISHDLAAIERLCGRALLLDRGRVRHLGPSRDVVGAYQRLVDGLPLDEHEGQGAAEAEITAIEILDGQDRGTHRGTTGAPLRIRVPYRATRMLRVPRFELNFYAFDTGTLESQCTGAADGDTASSGHGLAEFEIPSLGLQPGVYTLGVTITEQGAARPCAWHYGRATLYVEDGPRVMGKFYMRSSFALREADTRAAAGPEAGRHEW
jgi:ABC-type polysaccharide/polyol phosphate transport system ATPase subunit